MATGYLNLTKKFLGLSLPPVSLQPRFQTPIVIVFTLALAILLAMLPLRSAFLLVVGSIFLVSMVLKPTLAVYALIPVIPFSSMVGFSAAGARVGLMELLLLLGLTTWVLKLLVRHSIDGEPVEIAGGPLLVPFLLFLTAVSLSWLTTFSIGASLVETIKWLEVLALYLLIFNLLPAKEIRWVVFVIILTGMAQAGLGLYQFVFKVGPDGFLLFDGRFMRAYGTFAQPNPYAGYLGLVLPLALSLTLWAFEASPTVTSVTYSASSHVGNTFVRTGYILLRLLVLSFPLVFMLAALFASQSRGAWVGLGVASVVTIVVRSKKAALLFAGLVLGGTVLLLLGSFNLGTTPADADGIGNVVSITMQRFVNAGAIFSITEVATTPVTDANFATVERLAHWQAARDMWRDNPWTGVGFGNYAAIYPAYAVGRWLDPLGHAHNYPLNLGAETGLVGVVVYLIFWIWTYGVLWLAVRRSEGFYRAVAAGGIGIITHLHIHNMVDNLYVQGMYLHIAIILAIISITYSRHQRHFLPVSNLGNDAPNPKRARFRANI